MSGANAQPWEFIVIKDPQTRAKIAQSFVVESQRTLSFEKVKIEEMRHPGAGAHAQGQVGFGDAPVLIVVCGDVRTLQATVLAHQYLSGDWAVFHMNLSNATLLMQLAAFTLGLGAQWVSVSEVWEEELKAILDIPPFFRIYTIVPVGYPAYKPPPPYRRELKELVHLEKFDRSKYRTEEDIWNFILQLRKRTTPAYRT